MDKMRVSEIVRHHKRGIVKELVGAILLTIGLVGGVVTVTTAPSTTSQAHIASAR